MILIQYSHSGAWNPDSLPATNFGAGELLAAINLYISLIAIGLLALGFWFCWPCYLEQQNKKSKVTKFIFHFPSLLQVKKWLEFSIETIFKDNFIFFMIQVLYNDFDLLWMILIFYSSQLDPIFPKIYIYKIQGDKFKRSFWSC